MDLDQASEPNPEILMRHLVQETICYQESWETPPNMRSKADLTRKSMSEQACYHSKQLALNQEKMLGRWL